MVFPVASDSSSYRVWFFSPAIAFIPCSNGIPPAQAPGISLTFYKNQTNDIYPTS